MQELAVGRVVRDSLPAALPSPALALFAAAIPTLLAIAFWPTLQSAFFLPKNLVLVAATAILAIGALFTRTAFLRAENGAERWFFISNALFLFAMLISAAGSSRKELAIQPLLMIVAGSLLLPLTSAALSGRSDWMMRGIAISGFCVAVVVIANRAGFDVFSPFGLHPSFPNGRMRISATLGNPNFVASYVAASAPAMLFFAVQRTRAAWVWRIALVASFAAVWWTQSRIGIVCFFLAITLPMLFRSKVWKKVAIVAILLLFAVSAVVLNRANPRSFSTAASGRVFLWRASLFDGVHLLGDGPGTFYYFYPARMGRWFTTHSDPSMLSFADMQEHAHNDFLEFLISTGVLGFVTLLGVLGFGIAALIRYSKINPYAIFPLAGVSAIVLSACFDFPFHRAETWALLWLWFSFAFLAPGRTNIQFRNHATALLPVGLLSVVAFGLAIRPAIASYYVHEGLAWEAQSGDAQAVQEYVRALRWDRTSADAQFYLARALVNARRPDEALAQTKIAQHWVEEPALYGLRAQILQRLGRREEGFHELDQALRSFPYDHMLAHDRVEMSAEPEK